ncbi:MAG: hypothetical protein IPJ31_15555 [Bacteroidetes bacterium]|nr:hypothetical protein [Bacteroidota bacterium]
MLSDYAINGQPNIAKPIAGMGLFVLCISLSFFWFLFSRYIKVGKYACVVIRISGTLAMIVILFLFTNINHDLVINMASILGLVATSGIFIGLYKSKLYTFLLLDY